MPEFYVILAENYQNTRIFMIFARKINKISDFCMTFARKIPEFYIIARFFWVGAKPPSPMSPTPMAAWLSDAGDISVLNNYTECLRLRLGVSISPILRLRTARSQPAIGHSLAAVHYGTRTAAILNAHGFVIKSSLFTGKWVG